MKVSILISLVWCVVATATATEAADIRVRVVGVEEAKGNVSAALFRSGDDFEAGKAYAKVAAPASVEGIELVFADVAPGRYGLSVFHDINANKKIDTSFVGAPTELYGFSNNARGRFGPPDFDDFAFKVSEEDVNLEVRLK